MKFSLTLIYLILCLLLVIPSSVYSQNLETPTLDHDFENFLKTYKMANSKEVKESLPSVSPFVKSVITDSNMQSPEYLRQFWLGEGPLRVVQDDTGNALAELILAPNSSMGQIVIIQKQHKSLLFDLFVKKSDRFDKLIIEFRPYNNQRTEILSSRGYKLSRGTDAPIHLKTIQLSESELDKKYTYNIPLDEVLIKEVEVVQKIGKSGELFFRLVGPSTRTSVIWLDNLKIY